MQIINVARYKGVLAEKGITQSQLAKSLGKAPSTVSAWVHGFAKPSNDNWIQDIEKLLDLQPGSLLISESGQ